MSSLKATKPVGTQATEPVKKPAAKSSSSAAKAPASKPAPKAEQKPREPKKKCKQEIAREENVVHILDSIKRNCSIGQISPPTDLKAVMETRWKGGEFKIRNCWKALKSHRDPMHVELALDSSAGNGFQC
ncbi:hypothetical protein DKX38_015797 [Salix brachista]|uniref:Uncharacterized protein n=1 Tax=Salix brachista TaxID=2182728 RepID=A0A5N5L679_9ROSI|nr:hypothetical protein DKX38_015797 [Salix brachista]